MAIGRIEKIVAGVVFRCVEPGKDGKYRCFLAGRNMRPSFFATLDEVADFLRANDGSGVRMNPGWGLIRDNIYIDGAPR